MYSTCLFCHSNLGANEVIESFPIGRRLAFDAALSMLEQAWREAEEIAAISDSTFLPEGVADRLDALKRTT